MITWINFNSATVLHQFNPVKVILPVVSSELQAKISVCASSSGVISGARSSLSGYLKVMLGYSGYFGVLFFFLGYLKRGGVQEWVCDVTRPVSMKVTVNFGAVRVIVPCGKGDLPVKQLMDLAITRYKKATGKVRLLFFTVSYLISSTLFEFLQRNTRKFKLWIPKTWFKIQKGFYVACVLLENTLSNSFQ